jgi:hypothetical protein
MGAQLAGALLRSVGRCSIPESVSQNGDPFCEGNHVRKVLVRSRLDSEPTEEYSLDLDLSPVRVVHQQQREESGTENCGSGRGCSAEVRFIWLGPDDVKLRVAHWR